MLFFEALKSWLFPKKNLYFPPFGRGLHTLPNLHGQEQYQTSLESFTRGNILEGYTYFFDSITHENSEKKFYTEVDGSLQFSFIQGCAIIRGIVTKEYCTASAIIGSFSDMNVAMKRHLLERNFELTYAHFGNNSGVLALSIFIQNSTITPQKILYPLRELALNADYEKEFIVSEFDETPLLECAHLQPLDSTTLQRNYTFMKQWINETKKGLLGLPSNDNTGIASFSYLALLLQIDYLLIPHKKMGQKINETITSYFLEDEKLTEDKNHQLENYIDTLSEMNFDLFSTQFYETSYQFSSLEEADFSEVSQFIEESLQKVKWYKNNRSYHVIENIYRYISLYLLYNYGLHPSLKILLHIHVEMYAQDFFNSTENLYNTEQSTFNKARIKSRIEEAIEPYKNRFNGLKNFSDALNYSDLNHFSQSFYMQIKNLDYTEE